MHSFSSKRRLVGAIMAAALAVPILPASAQAFGEKTVKLIVPFAAG